MLKNILYVFVFLLFVVLGAMWLSINKNRKNADVYKTSQPQPSEQEIIETIFDEEFV